MAILLGVPNFRIFTVIIKDMLLTDRDGPKLKFDCCLKWTDQHSR